MTFIHQKPDLEGIARNLTALDPTHLSPAEAPPATQADRVGKSLSAEEFPLSSAQLNAY
jgi:hypothetical protein